jgi:Phage major capsid protein E.
LIFSLHRGLAAINNKVVRDTNSAHYTALRDIFFPRGATTAQKYSSYDYKANGILLSEEALRGQDPTKLNFGESFDEALIYGVYRNPSVDVDFKKAEDRVWDELIQNPQSEEQRQLYLLAEARAQMDAGLDLQEEELVANLILKGKFDTLKGTQKFPVDTALLGLAGAGLTTNPDKVLNSALTKLAKKRARITRMIVNPNTAITLQGSAAFKTLLDNRRIFGNEINHKGIEDNGMAYVGTVSGLGAGAIDVYAYWGTDSSDEYLIPDNNALFAGDRIGKMDYTGVIALGANGISTSVAAVRNWVVGRETNLYLSTVTVAGQTSPCPIITELDKYGVMTGIN